MRRYFLCVLVMILGAAPLFGQSVRPAAGDRVRVQLNDHSGKQTFIFKNIVSDTMVLQRLTDISAVRVPLNSVERLQLSRGHRSAGARALRGAAWGFGIGAALGATLGFASGDDEDGFLRFTAGEKASVAAIFVGGTGLVVGTVTGLVFNPERWRTIPLEQVQLARTAEGTLAISYQIRL